MRFLKERQLSIYALSKGTGISRGTFNHWLTGKGKSLNGETITRILEHVQCTYEQVFTNSSRALKIPLVGRVAAGEHVIMYDHSDVRYVDFPPGLAPGVDYECLEVDGFSMPPALPGWRVFYSIEPVDMDKVLNRPCVVRLTDGRLLFKVVRRYGDSKKLYSLHSWSPTVQPIEPVEIAEARPFRALTPPD